MKFLFSKTTILTTLVTLALAWVLPQLIAQEGWPAPFDEERPQALGGQSPGGFEKEMVDIPPQEEKPTIDASDFRDPFFFLKRDGENSRETLTPGTTVDGLRFNTYNESIGFVDIFYKNSNFILKDVFCRIELVN